MKKRLAFVLVAFAMMLSFLPMAAVHAEEPYSEEYYRVYDFTHEMSEEDTDRLDSECLRIMNQYRMDVAAAAVPESMLEGESLSAFAEQSYEYWQFGYGAERSGTMLVWNRDNDELIIYACGDALPYVDNVFIDEVNSRLEPMLEGDVTVVLETFVNLMESRYAGEEAAVSAVPAETAEPSATYNPVRPAKELPSWYPEDPAGFEKFHDPSADRLIDEADIFTPDEEAEIRTALRIAREKTDKDIVVYTDVTSYGFSKDILCADFYDFNGYGVGDDYEGLCLFVCMDPKDRGFWTAGTGPDTMALHTYSNANRLDDVLFDFFKAGAYADGIMAWTAGVEGMYLKGVAFAPEWFPERGHENDVVYNENGPRVLDQIGLMSETEKADLEERIVRLKEKYGVDFAIVTADDTCDLSMEEYLDKYYRAMGFGTGENRSGMGLMLRGEYLYSRVASYGGARFLSDKNGDRMETRISLEDSAYEAALRWLDLNEHFLKTGRVPHGWIYWLTHVLMGVIPGLIYGSGSLSGAKRKMKAERSSGMAYDYLVKGSESYTEIVSTFLSETVTSRTIHRSSSGGSSSGGGSSYHSSYSGSSGTSHSGSGRSF